MKHELKIDDIQPYINEVMETKVADSIANFIRIKNVTKSFYLPDN
jgi:hypothetical protein